MPAKVRLPVLVVSASVLAAPVSLTAPSTSSASLSVRAKPAPVETAPNVPTRLVGRVRLAEATALPVRNAARIEPPAWTIEPAETRSSTFVALTLPARVRLPVPVVSANVLDAPVSVTGPVTDSASLSVSAKPAPVVNTPRVPTRLAGWVRLADVTARPVNVPASTFPPLCPIEPWLAISVVVPEPPSLTTPAKFKFPDVRLTSIGPAPDGAIIPLTSSVPVSWIVADVPAVSVPTFSDIPSVRLNPPEVTATEPMFAIAFAVPANATEPARIPPLIKVPAEITPPAACVTPPPIVESDSVDSGAALLPIAASAS